jgi:phenylacetate-CoA ligase
MGYRTKRLQDVARGVRETKALVARERWPRERLEALQRQRLDELVTDIRTRSPYWRRRLPAGRRPLSELPPMTKAELMDGFDELVMDPRLRLDELLAHLDEVEGDALHLGEYRVMTTSGSSGRKAVFAYDRPGWVGIVAMFLRRSEWVGLRPHLPRTRIALVAGGSPTHMSRRGASTLDVGLHRVLSLAATQSLGELVDRLNDFQPDFLNVYPSIGGLLADEQLAGRLRVNVRAMTTNSEPLTPSMRERLERAFGVRPTNFYGTTEGLYGHDCEHGSMHLFDDMCIVENVDDDGRPVPPGDVGSRLLVTNLFNRVQPLIRFEVTDLLATDPDPCPCGRTLMRVQSLDGRAEDVLRLDGVAVHPLQFGVVTADPDVRELQVVQEGATLRLRVALRNGSAGAEERLGRRVRDQLLELGVRRPVVSVERVDALERSPAGKVQIVVAEH